MDSVVTQILLTYFTGEIYQVDDNMLSKLDILEDHPSYYVRELDDIYIKKAWVILSFLILHIIL